MIRHRDDEPWATIERGDPFAAAGSVLSGMRHVEVPFYRPRGTGVAHTFEGVIARVEPLDGWDGEQ